MDEDAPKERPGNRTRDVVRSSGTTSVAAALGVASGLLLDVAIASGFGAGVRTDAFFVAARIPIGLTSLLMVGANQALVPAISTWLVAKRRQESWRLTTSLLGGAALVGFSLAAVAALLAGPLVRLTAPGLTPEATATATALARILFLLVPLVALAEVFRALLNALRSFVAPALMHVVLNGVAAAIVVGTEGGIERVAWAYVAGAVAQLAFLFVVALRRGYRVVPGASLRDPEVTAAARLSVRPLVGAGLNPLARVGEQAIISFLPPGAISIMNYGYRLISAIGGSVLFRSVVVVILPRLTRATTEGHHDEIRQLTRLGVQIMLVVSVPLTAMMAVLASPAVLVVFRRGNFSEADAALLGTVLAVYAASLVGSAVQRALLAPFYARLDTKTPLRNTVYGVAANLALVPVFLLALGDRPFAVVGVAAAYSIAQYVNVAHAWFRLRRDAGIHLTGVGATALKLLAAGAVMALVLVAGVALADPQDVGSRVEQLAITSLIGAAGLAVFVGAAAALGLLDLARRSLAIRRPGRQPPSHPAQEGPADPRTHDEGAGAS